MIRRPHLTRSTAPLENRRAVHGFTLVELMIVVVLIAIMTAMIIPEMKGTFEDALLRSTARQLVNVCNLAYSQAVTVSQPHRVRLDRKTGRYAVERPRRDSEGGSGFVTVQNVSGGEGELDTRISIEIRKLDEEPEAPRGEESSEPTPQDLMQSKGRPDIIAFYPDGTADNREIVLKDREGFELALHVNPTTARVEIVEKDSKPIER